MSVSIRISKENYDWLNEISGELRKKEKKPISIDDALSYLNLRKKKRLSDIGGSLSMNDEEVKTFNKNISRGWKNWRIRSV